MANCIKGCAGALCCEDIYKASVNLHWMRQHTKRDWRRVLPTRLQTYEYCEYRMTQTNTIRTGRLRGVRELTWYRRRLRWQIKDGDLPLQNAGTDNGSMGHMVLSTSNADSAPHSQYEPMASNGANNGLGKGERLSGIFTGYLAKWVSNVEYGASHVREDDYD